MVLAPVSAVAFEKSNIGASDAKSVNQSGDGANPQDLAQLPLAQTPPAQDKNDGTAINIPGLGTVGVIPKLDFGMELLYSGESKHEEVLPESDDDDLQIRGTIRHRF